MYTQKRSYKLKALALFLAVFTILSTMPVAFAATALTVKKRYRVAHGERNDLLRSGPWGAYHPERGRGSV